MPLAAEMIRRSGHILCNMAWSTRTSNSVSIALMQRRCNSTIAAADAASTSLAAPASHLTELQSLGFGSWTSPIGLIQNTLDFMHSYCGLPWWGTIAAFTVAMRLTLLPFSWKQAKLAHRQTLLKPHIAPIQEKMNEYKTRGLDDQYRQEAGKYWSFMGTHGCSPFKMMAFGVMPLPFYVSTFVALRQLLGAPLPSMHSGGIAWFTDLCASDPYFILPAATSAMLALNIELSQRNSPNPPTAKMKLLMRVLPLVSIPFVAYQASGLAFYFFMTNVSTTIQSWFLRSPYARSKFHYDPPPSTLPSKADDKIVIKAKRESKKLQPVLGNPWDKFVQPAPSFVPKPRNGKIKK